MQYKLLPILKYWPAFVAYARLGCSEVCVLRNSMLVMKQAKLFPRQESRSSEFMRRGPKKRCQLLESVKTLEKPAAAPSRPPSNSSRTTVTRSLALQAVVCENEYIGVSLAFPQNCPAGCRLRAE